MLLFSKLVDETQMGNPRDHAVRDISSQFSIFLPLRAIYFRSYHYETPCKLIFVRRNIINVSNTWDKCLEEPRWSFPSKAECRMMSGLFDHNHHSTITARIERDI